MPADINRVVLVGRLTRDPEMRRTAGGDPVATLRLGFTSRARDGDGGWADRSNYVDITLFGARAELAERHLTKGRRVGIDGRLSWSEWATSDGARRQGIDVVAGDIFFLDPPREEAAAA
jgi:single-strand DNA-binding protein